jgi:hypothetical protein
MPRKVGGKPFHQSAMKKKSEKNLEIFIFQKLFYIVYFKPI